MSDETEEQKKLMRQIDISCVQAFHTMDEIDAMVELAKKYRLAAVFTLPAFSAHVAERLQDTREIHAGGVVSCPGGGDTTGQKKRQAKELWEAGCREIDMVMNLTAFRSHEFSYVKEELLAIREQVPSAIFKVIIEAPQLTEQEICQAVEIPVVAIGGISLGNVSQLSGSGICGIAVISAIYGAADIRRASLDLKAATEEMLRS